MFVLHYKIIIKQLIHIIILFKIFVITPTLATPLINNSKIMAEISYGELVDKITILEIKTERITDPKKLKNIHIELASLYETYQQYIDNSTQIQQLRHKLKTVNEILWDIEDDLRAKERNQIFDNEFIQLARRVYLNNDQRYAIKRRINILLGSHIIEEKSYTDYHITAKE